MGRLVVKILSFVMLVVMLTSAAGDGGKTVVFAGDSITDGGWGRSGGLMKSTAERNLKDLNHLYGHSYMMLCAARLECDHPHEGYVFHNRGISGNTLDDLAARWSDDVLSLNPDVVSILVGTNDVDKFLRHGDNEDFDFAGWEKKYRSLLDMTRLQNPKVRFVLGAPFVAKSGKIGASANYDLRHRLIARCAETVKKIAADYDAVYLPYNEMFDRLTSEGDPAYWVWDGIHPTPAGHQSMADMWLRSVGSM